MAQRRPQAPGYKPRKPLTPQQLARLIRLKENTYSIYVDFKFGYRNKEDISALPPNVLVVGSQNVVTNAADRVAARQGYTLDGPAGNQNNYGIDSSYDFEAQGGNLRNLRKWGTTLEVRYVNPVSSVVSWVTLLSTLSATKPCNFTNFWDYTTELTMFCLFVNGDNNIYEWTGGVASFASATATTITISGTPTPKQLGFYDNAADSAKFKLLIGGVTYTYTGISGQTFTGITPNPTGAGIAVGDAVVQATASTAGSAITGIASTTFNFGLISTLKNQIWYGSLTNATVYVSKTNNYKDTTFSAVRLASEGALITLDAPPVAFEPLATQIYCSAGRDQWWVSSFIPQTQVVGGVAVAIELLTMTRLKTTKNQGAQSQGLVTTFKNAIIYVSNEQIINTLGPVRNVLAEPQITNLSDSIKYDIDAYDFTGGQIFYDNYFIYVMLPKHGVVRMFNVQKKYWEAPQTIAVERLYHVLATTTGSVLYGHSSLTNESYQLFTGYNDNGNPINCIAAFAYDNMSSARHEALRPVKKNYNQFYSEGYIAGNTNLTVTWNYDFGGFTAQASDIIKGTDTKILFNTIADGSLGKQPLGEFPIGSIFNTPVNIPKFRKLSTMVRQNYYEYQTVFSSNDIDQQWEILAFGPAQTVATEMAVEISE